MANTPIDCWQNFLRSMPMKLPQTFTGERTVHAIIETPHGSRNKFDYDETFELFTLKKVFPPGTSLPFPMGFIPRTKGEDGDPLDIFVLTEDDTYPGCLIESRVIGIVKIYQADADGRPIRNDRVLAVPTASADLATITDIAMVDQQKLQALIDFCIFYNRYEGKQIDVRGTGNAAEALACIRKGVH